MKIYVTSIFVDDQQKALDFYTDVLGFEVKNDIPLGDYRWLTVVSKEQRDGTELLLEPSSHPAVDPFRNALVNDGIPAASFKTDDIEDEVRRLAERGVEISQPVVTAGNVSTAVFDDGCGNLIQIVQMHE